MFDTNGSIPDAEVDVPLRIRNHPKVSELREQLGEKREELEELHRKRREADARRQELRERFEAALKGESDTDPRDVREEILVLEETLDTFEERRLDLQADIAGLEQEINEAAEDAREEITEEVAEPLRQLHAAYAHHLQQVLRAHLKLKEFDALERGHQRVGSQHIERPELPVDELQVDGFPGLVQALKQLRALRRDGFDVDPDLLDRLTDEVHA